MDLVWHHIHLILLFFNGLYVCLFYIYLTRFNAEDQRIAAFQRLLLAGLTWAFFDLTITYLGRVHSPEVTRAAYRWLSFLFLYYTPAAGEMILSLSRRVTWRTRLLLYSPFVLLYLAGHVWPQWVSAATFGVPDLGQVTPYWNQAFKLGTIPFTGSLLVYLFWSSFREQDRRTRLEMRLLLSGGLATWAWIAISQVLMQALGPGFPWLANLGTAFTALAAFWGIRRYGRLFSPASLYQTTVNVTPIGMVHLRRGRVAWVNQAMSRLMGRIPADGLKGLAPGELMDLGPAGPDQDRLAEALIRGEVRDREVRLRAGGSREVFCLVSGAPFDPEAPTEGALLAFQDISRRRLAEAERERLIGELRQALAEVKTLSGLLPICANCKKVRDDSGYWNQIEEYLAAHSAAEFSHSICPECVKDLYPEIYARRKDSLA